MLIYELDILDILGFESAGDNSEASAEVEVKRSQMSGRSCNVCRIQFETVSDQKSHFKSVEHVENVRKGSNFNSNDDSDSEDSNESGDNDEGDDGQRKDSAMVQLRLSDGLIVNVYKSILQSSSTSTTTSMNQLNKVDTIKYLKSIKDSKWAVLLLSGGRFAGAVFRNSSYSSSASASASAVNGISNNNNNNMLVHKTIQKYTTRRKQGGSQSKHDQQGTRYLPLGTSHT